MKEYQEQYRVGLIGEWKAENYLKKQGMRIEARRFRFGAGEIDLIVRDGSTLCFVEVKYRPKGKPGDGMVAVDGIKRERIRKAAVGYLKGRKEQKIRFDVLEITVAGILYLKNAF